jgi:hypothetical protein
MQLIETLIYAVVAGFFCRTISIMVSYSLSYGQLFGWVKLGIARRLHPDLVKNALYKVKSSSHGDEITKELYDRLCPESFLLSLLDCAFCIGFWVSMICAAGLYFFFGNHGLIFILLPALTFFYTEKI